MELLNIFIASAAGTGFFTLIYKLIEKFIDYKFESHRSELLTKQQLIDEVIKICSEARQAGFNLAPRSYEHVVYIANKLKLRNEELGKLMETFSMNWTMCGKLQSGEFGNIATLNQTLTTSFQKLAEKNCELLLKGIKKL